MWRGGAATDLGGCRRSSPTAVAHLDLDSHGEYRAGRGLAYQWKAGGSAGDDRKRLCQRTRYYALGSHTASPGLVFSKSVAWPAPFDNGVFIGQHGSCERGPAGSGDRKDGP